MIVSLGGRRPEPPTRAWPRSRARSLIGLGARIVLAAAVLAVLVGIAEAALWEPSRPAHQAPAADACLEPPCPPESLPGLRHLPLLVSPLGYLLAALLGAAAWLMSVLSERRRRRPGRALLPVLGPVLVLVAMEVVPHVVNPCLVAGALGDDLPPGCSRTVHGVDVHDRWHPLHHAVVGGLPAALGYAALLRRRRPEVFTCSEEAAPSAGAR